MRIAKNARTSVVGILFLMLGLAAFAACAPSNDPFAVGDRAQPAAQPTTTGQNGEFQRAPDTAESLLKTPEEREQEHLDSLYAASKDTIRIANWDDKSVQLANNLVGYMMVYGFNYRVELVEASEVDYKTALAKGELDLVFSATDDWAQRQIEAGTITQIADILDSDSDGRILAYSAFEQKAPDLVEFLKKIDPDDEVFSNLAASITSGRVGVKPNVAALKYLKENEAAWTQWVPAEAATGIKSAIASGKTSLVNRLCIPDGGSGGGSPNCGT